MESDDLRYDHAVAAAMLIVDQFDAEPDAPKYKLVSMCVFIVLEAMKAYEQEKRSDHPRFSSN